MYLPVLGAETDLGLPLRSHNPSADLPGPADPQESQVQTSSCPRSQFRGSRTVWASVL